MTKSPIPLAAKDLAQFTRALAGQLGQASPSHLTLMNMVARAAGYQNVQHMRAVCEGAGLDAPISAPKLDMRLIERALAQFDDAGRLVQWPAKRAVQTLALWALWAVLPASTVLRESEVSAALVPEHTFGDPATLRRTMVSCKMLSRKVGAVDYCRVEQTPPPEALALIRAITARRKARRGAVLA
jgi:hypothetical protein